MLNQTLLLLLTSIFPLSSGPISIQNISSLGELPGTELPLEGVNKRETYAYLQAFLKSSPTFAQFWELSIKTPRSGAQTSWNSLADNACLVVRSFSSLVSNDGWFRNRCPWVDESTYNQFVAAAQKIAADPAQAEQFYLMMYARDFGWAKTGQGQFHQKTGQPIIEQILNELGKDPKICTAWIADHSMPAEIFLGEVSKRGVEQLISQYQDDNLLPMVGLLSLLELNCLTLDRSAVRQPNAKIIAQLMDPKQHGELLSDYINQRLLRLSASEMLLSKVTESKQDEVAKASQLRFEKMKTILHSYSPEVQQKIARFLEEVELHYIAATFPKMSPEAIVRMLKISAEHCFPSLEGPAKHNHVINMRQDLAVAWDKTLQTTANEEVEALLSTDESNWLVWTPLEPK